MKKFTHAFIVILILCICVIMTISVVRFQLDNIKKDLMEQVKYQTSHTIWEMSRVVTNYQTELAYTIQDSLTENGYYDLFKRQDDLSHAIFKEVCKEDFGIDIP